MIDSALCKYVSGCILRDDILVMLLLLIDLLYSVQDAMRRKGIFSFRFCTCREHFVHLFLSICTQCSCGFSIAANDACTT